MTKTIAYLDCFSGISGNMLLGALIDAGLSIDDLRADLARLPLKGYELKAERVTKRGIAATHVEVATGHEHAHRGIKDILQIIEQSTLPKEVTDCSRRIFTRLAEAEARVHGQPVDEVHFHEVGAVDAIIDIVGAVTGLDKLGVERVICSPLPVARGWVVGGCCR